jgi:uncharacterized protein with HEPN domain
MQAAAEAIHGNDRETAMTIAKDAPQAMQDAVASVGSDGAYFDINADILWDTVQVALPELLEKLKPDV